jgi:hypothetical protein
MIRQLVGGIRAAYRHLMFGREPRPRVLVFDRDGARLEPWQVRAGMVVTKTTYSHDDRTVRVVLDRLPSGG